MKHSNQIVLLQKKIFFIHLFILILICEIYISSFKVNLVLQMICFAGLLLSGKTAISLGFVKTIAPLFFVFIIGILGFLIHRNPFSDFVKDISYFIKPVIGIAIGYLACKKSGSVFLLYKAILFVGIFSASIHVIGIFLSGNFFSASISTLRGDFGLDNFIEIFAFYILLFSDRILDHPLSRYKFVKTFFLALLLLSILIYFSRTMFVAFGLIGFALFGYSRITLKTLKITGIFFILIGLFYAYLFSIRINRNSEGIEAFLYKVKNAPAEIFKTRVNRENHEELWDHWRGYEAYRAYALIEDTPFGFVTGTGFGSLVNLKFKAPISQDGGMKYISRLHNGYMFVFYKTGFFGSCFYLFFLANLYMKIYHPSSLYRKKFILRMVSSIGLFYFFTSLIITGIYIPKDTIILIFGGFLTFISKPDESLQ